MNHSELRQYFMVSEIVLCQVGPLVGVDEQVADIPGNCSYDSSAGQEAEIECAGAMLLYGRTTEVGCNGS